jgi:hypothetical protein
MTVCCSADSHTVVLGDIDTTLRLVLEAEETAGLRGQERPARRASAEKIGAVRKEKESSILPTSSNQTNQFCSSALFEL